VVDNATFLAGIIYCMEGDGEQRVSSLSWLGQLLTAKNAPDILLDTVSLFVTNLAGDMKKKKELLPPLPAEPDSKPARQGRRHNRLPREKYHNVDESIDPEGKAAAEKAAGKPEDRRNTVLADALSLAEKEELLKLDQENPDPTVH